MIVLLVECKFHSCQQSCRCLMYILPSLKSNNMPFSSACRSWQWYSTDQMLPQWGLSASCCQIKGKCKFKAVLRNRDELMEQQTKKKKKKETVAIEHYYVFDPQLFLQITFKKLMTALDELEGLAQYYLFYLKVWCWNKILYPHTFSYYDIRPVIFQHSA